MMEVILIILLGLITLGVLRWPETSVAVLFALYAFEQLYQTHIELFVQIPLLMNAFTAVLLLMACFKRILSKELGNPFSVTTAFVVLFLFFASFSTIWSIYPESTEMLVDRLPYWALWILFAPLILRNLRDVQRCFVALMILAPIVLISLIFTTERFEGRSALLLGGLTGNPLQVATLGGNLVIIAVCLNPHFKKAITFVLRWALVITGFAGAIWAGTRGQTIAAVLASLGAYPLSRRVVSAHRFFAVVFAISILAGGALWAAIYFGGGRFQIDTLTEAYQSTRIYMSTRVLDAWINAGPLAWLQGLGTSGSFAVIGSWSHILYVEILVETGLFGLAAFVAAVISGGIAWMKSYKITKSFDDARGVWVAIGALVIFEMLVGLSNQRIITAEKLYGLLIVVGALSRDLVRRHAQSVR